MNARDIIKRKGCEVLTLADNESVMAAVGALVGSNVGALLVLDGDEAIVGILTERDVLRACHRRKGDLAGARVEELMTRKVLIGLPGDSVSCMMAVMTDKQIRHLPILDEGQLVGLISIRDLVDARADSSDMELRYLRDYIRGRYPN